MVGRFSACLRPVVTGRAGAGRDTSVSEYRPCPCDCAVTAIACHRGRKMCAWFSLGNRIVVAFGAAAWRNAIVRKEGRLPIGRAMAAVAVDRGRQVVRGFEGGNDSSAGRVALHALSRRPAKHPLDVAALAGDLRMPACELKSCRRVGKLDIAAATFALRIDLAGKSNEQTTSQEQDAHEPASTSHHSVEANRYCVLHHVLSPALIRRISCQAVFELYSVSPQGMGIPSQSLRA